MATREADHRYGSAVAVFLGLVTAVLFGSADFFGGISAKKTSVLNVVAFAHLIGLIGATAIAPFIAEQFGWQDFAIGIASGAFGGIGVALLYRGLAIGPMVVVAPLTAITSAAVPAIWGVLGGERLAALGWVGVAVALVAIGLISMPADADDAPITASIVGQSLLAGACFGAMFILFDAVGEETAPWPIVGARLMTSTVLLGFILTARREGLSTVKPAMLPIVLTGLFDTGSNVIFLFATNLGDLSVVAVLSSLYPAATVVLARFWLGEKMSRLQLTGMSLALLATALIAVG